MIQIRGGQGYLSSFASALDGPEVSSIARLPDGGDESVNFVDGQHNGVHFLRMSWQGSGRRRTLRFGRFAERSNQRFSDWPGTAQVCQIKRTVTRGVETTTEMHYAITCVPRSQADAAQLSNWWRSHWGISNRLHWVRDVSFGEDRSRIRTKSTPQIFSAFRNAAIGHLRSLGATNITAELRECPQSRSAITQTRHHAKQACPG